MSAATLYRAVEWDAVNWARALMWLRARSRLRLAGARVLEIGGGRGTMARWFADQGASVLCVDSRMKEAAPWEFPAAGRVRFVQGDALALPVGLDAQIVFLKSVLGAIGGRGGLAAQAKVCQAMSKSLAVGGGEFWILENLLASRLHQVLRERLVPWAGQWRYVSIGELSSFMSSASSLETRSFGFSAVFGRSEWQRRLLGHVDAKVFDRCVPARWRYLGAVLAAFAGSCDGGHAGRSDTRRKRVRDLKPG